MPPSAPGGLNANGAAQTLSRIEQQRLHADLTPHFRCTIVANEARSTATLRGHLEGPPGRLSHSAIEITTSLRNDTGRTVAPQPLSIGEWTRYCLTPTIPPSWSASDTEDWRRDYANEPVRLSITARSKGREWIVPLEVTVTIEAAS